MAYYPNSEIAFSQVREDAAIELEVIDRLRQQNHPLRVLIVASGGCTALSLLASPDVGEIIAVDANIAQLELVELRRQALINLSLVDQLQLIGADLTTSGEKRLEIYQQLRDDLSVTTRQFWDQRPAQIAFGVNRVGRFEQLFRELSQALSNCGINPLENPKSAIKSDDWNIIFAQIFDRVRLAKIFGENAVNYSMDRSFGDHFADVFAQSLKRFSPEDNYFLTQVWQDQYTQDQAGLPFYLQTQIQQKILTYGVERLQLHHGNFASKMLTLATENKFDLIQFSNISDWMPIPELNQMLTQAVNCLTTGGVLLGRRLNGDHCLAEVMDNYLCVDWEFSQYLWQKDRSFFYREIVVGFNNKNQ